MFDKTKRFFLVFNGEIYNFKSLKKKLRNNSINSNSDTEVLLYTLIERGISSINELEGMFSFIFYDTQNKTLFMGRDRFGIKPFYYTYINKSIVFSSEIKPLIKMKKNICLNNLAFCNFFLKGSMDFDKETFFNGINSVEPGTYGILKNNKVIFKKYWRLEDTYKNYTKKSNFKNSCNHLEHLLKKSLSKHLISDRKIGLFLSGGTDSNALLNLISQNFSKKKLNTFTYGFKNASNYDESDRVSKLLTNSKNIDNFSTYLKPNEIIDNFEKVTQILESPFTSIRIFAMKKLYELARKKGCKVILEGDGGDEVFGGYDYNVFSYLKDKFHNEKSNKSKIVDYLKKFVEASGRNKSHIINLILTNNYQFSSTSDGTIFVNSDFFKETFLNQNISENFYEHNRIKKLNFLKNSQLKDINYIKLPRSLKYKDRLSMSVGIETRVPLLDHKLAEYCFNLPNKYKFKGDISRYIFKSVAKKKYLTKYKFEVSKKTIADPQKIWMKTHLKDYFLDVINSTSFKNLDYFNHKIIKSEFLKFCKEENYLSSFAFFQILSFYEFNKIFFKNN